jgi:hypothetical protein
MPLIMGRGVLPITKDPLAPPARVVLVVGQNDNMEVVKRALRARELATIVVDDLPGHRVERPDMVEMLVSLGLGGRRREGK